MRVNIYAEEMTERLEIIRKETADGTFTGLRIYLELPVTIGGHGPPDEQNRRPPLGQHRSVDGSETVHPPVNGKVAQVAGPFIHHPGDDDSSAITFWGKRDLRKVLHQAIAMLDEHYGADHE